MKRIISVLTALALIACALTFSAYAAEAEEIATAEQLLAISDGEYLLTADIDLSGTVFTAAAIQSFSGILDGNGHTVSGLEFEVTEGQARLGLIGTLTGAVKNLIVKGGADVTGEYVRAGGIAATSNGTVTNCRAEFDVTVNVTGNAFVGGVVGYNRESSKNGTITDCYSAGDVVINGADSAYAGGVTCAYGTVNGCVRESGSVTVSLESGRLAYAAGIAAYEAAARNCVNRSDVTAKATFQAYAGGISAFFGSSGKLTVQYCDNSGAVSARVTGGEDIDVSSALATAGGIAAYTANTAKVGTTVNESACTSIVRNVRNSGAVRSAGTGELPDYAGGAVGVVNGLVYNCYETAGDVSGTACGPIYGALNPSGVLRGKVRDCKAYGSGEYNTVNGTAAADGAVTYVSAAEAAEAAAALTIANTHAHFYCTRFLPADGSSQAALRTVCGICGDYTDAVYDGGIDVDIERAEAPKALDEKVQISWRGLVSSDGSVTIDVDGGFSDGTRRVGVIFASTDKSEKLELAMKAVTDAAGDGFDEAIAAFNAGGGSTRVYAMAAARQLYWNDGKSAWTYRYNFNVPAGKKRAAMAFVVYEDENGVQVSFSNLDIQTAVAD